jgi:hypothetical protein
VIQGGRNHILEIAILEHSRKENIGHSIKTHSNIALSILTVRPGELRTKETMYHQTTVIKTTSKQFHQGGLSIEVVELKKTNAW